MMVRTTTAAQTSRILLVSVPLSMTLLNILHIISFAQDQASYLHFRLLWANLSNSLAAAPCQLAMKISRARSQRPRWPNRGRPSALSRLLKHLSRMHGMTLS